MSAPGPDVSSTVGPHNEWLCQGDIFSRVMVSRFGVSNAAPVEAVETGPAILVSHSCVIDKQSNKGELNLEYLTFLPLLAVNALRPELQGNARASLGKLTPYSRLYLGEIPHVGEVYASLLVPYTIPAELLRPELHAYGADDAGDDAGAMVRPTVNDTRVRTLTPETLELFWRKWAIVWTGVDPFPGDADVET